MGFPVGLHLVIFATRQSYECLLAKLFYLSTECLQERNGTYTSVRESPGMIVLP